MIATVEKLAKHVRALPRPALEEFLTWLADYECQRMDEWDEEIERDAAPGGRLQTVLDRVHADIRAGRTKPLDEVLGNS